jgi:acyl-coenzyme A thioesterase PaaI-like protein
MWNFEQISNEEIERQRKRYEPLTESVRQLIDATVRTEADDETVAAATAEIDSATAKLRRHQREGGWGVRQAPDGTGLAWGDAAIGVRNPFAPPMVVEHDGAETVHCDFRVGAPCEGPPNHLHGGLSALFLDQVLGDAASLGASDSVASTGTISFRYQRPTPLGDLHAEAAVQRVDGRKIYTTGHLADANGITVSAEGVFIRAR